MGANRLRQLECRHSPGFVGGVKYGLESDNLLNMPSVQGRRKLSEHNDPCKGVSKSSTGLENKDVASGNSRTAGNRVSRGPSMRIILEPQGSKFLSQKYAKNIDGSDYSKNE